VRIIIVLLLLFVTFSSRAQESGHFNLITDRDIYVSGETIMFKVYAPEDEKSGIVKICLVNTNGKIISEINKKMTDRQADGFMYLPDSLKTGSYLLCAVTKTSPSITEKELLICNRFTGFSETTSVLQATGNHVIVENPANIQIDGIGETYKIRDQVHASIHLPPELFAQIKGDLLVTAVEKIRGVKSVCFIRQSTLPVIQVAENDGIILEGFAKDSETGAPFKNGYIFFSVPDSIPGFSYFITGDNGYFSFLPDNPYKKMPAVVQGYNVDKKRFLKIVINHRDSLNAAIPSFENQPIPADLQNAVSTGIEATTLRKIFNYQELSITEPPLEKKKDYPFYGVPTEVVYPDLFVELPDFTEISRELLQGVKFRAYNRIPTIQVLNPSTLNFYSGPPLVLLDGVPVQDLNVIKIMGSKDIQRIEICRNERFYGDLSFQGVVAIYSTRRDNRRLTESADLVKLNLDALQPDNFLNIPFNQKSNEPDLRKVLMWKPRLKPEETFRVDFETSDIRGSYLLMVKGMKIDGSVFYKEQPFEVK
jgi:hypothetical protein